MQVVYKYLANGENTLLMLPQGAKILTVQKQGTQICFWVLQYAGQAPTQTRKIVKVGTGHAFDDTREHKYIGTIQELDGALIWHYFEVI